MVGVVISNQEGRCRFGAHHQSGRRPGAGEQLQQFAGRRRAVKRRASALLGAAEAPDGCVGRRRSSSRKQEAFFLTKPAALCEPSVRGVRPVSSRKVGRCADHQDPPGSMPEAVCIRSCSCYAGDKLRLPLVSRS